MTHAIKHRHFAEGQRPAEACEMKHAVKHIRFVDVPRVPAKGSGLRRLAR